VKGEDGDGGSDTSRTEGLFFNKTKDEGGEVTSVCKKLERDQAGKKYTEGRASREKHVGEMGLTKSVRRGPGQ